MPKTRKRQLQAGAKSVAIRIKHKIGGRKSTKGVKQLSTRELQGQLTKVRKKEVAFITRELIRRGKNPAIHSA